jgi:hypothetical protein
VLAAGDSVAEASARISGLAGCVTRTRTVKVSGTRIRTVLFTLDGRKLRT